MLLVQVYAEDGGNAQPSSLLTQLPAGAVSIDGATQRLIPKRFAHTALLRAEPSAPTKNDPLVLV